MSWFSLIGPVLAIIRMLVEIGQQNKWIKVGEDRQLAADLAAVLMMTEAGRNALREISSLGDDELDVFLRNLEPRPVADSK